MRKISVLSALTITTVLGSALSTSALPHAITPSAFRCDGVNLKKIGKAIAYPAKKAAGNGSKTANKAGQAVQYPVRKAGENTSHAAHKSGLK